MMAIVADPRAECPRCAYLADQVAFWKDQQKFAASAAATIADLDEEAPALRQLLRAEMERRRRAEDELVKVQYELLCLKGEQP